MITLTKMICLSDLVLYRRTEVDVCFRCTKFSNTVLEKNYNFQKVSNTIITYIK